jgi:hypothetical protein
MPALSGFLAPRPYPTEPEARREVGKNTAASNHREHLERARGLALELLATRGPGTIADLRDFAAERGVTLPFHLPWAGSVFLPHRKGEAWFEPTGVRQNTRHKDGNARKVNQYRLTMLGAAEWARRRG